MNTDIEKRFVELSNRADEKKFITFSEFLNIDEQSVLYSSGIKNAELFGGYDLAERKVASFGNEQRISNYPITLIKIEPVQKKFADNLTHRDFLGSLMGLGIKREFLGDIIINDKTGYLFCLNSISDFIINELNQVRHTTVKCEKIDYLPNGVIIEPDSTEIIVSSTRLDVLISGVYNLSRNDCNKLFLARKIFINGRVIENNSFIPEDDSLISVRGFGRFQFISVIKMTKKGKYVIKVMIYR